MNNATRPTTIDIYSAGQNVATYTGAVWDREVDATAPHPLFLVSVERELRAGETMRYETPDFVGALTWGQMLDIARASLSDDWAASCKAYEVASNRAARKAMGF